MLLTKKSVRFYRCTTFQFISKEESVLEIHGGRVKVFPLLCPFTVWKSGFPFEGKVALRSMAVQGEGVWETLPTLTPLMRWTQSINQSILLETYWNFCLQNFSIYSVTVSHYSLTTTVDWQSKVQSNSTNCHCAVVIPALGTPTKKMCPSTPPPPYSIFL